MLAIARELDPGKTLKPLESNHFEVIDDMLHHVGLIPVIRVKHAIVIASVEHEDQHNSQLWYPSSY